MRVRMAVAAVALLFPGCMAPPSPSQKLADSAYELNNATRFGRMDIALENVGPAARDDFAKRHAAWGRGIRVVDVEFAGMNMLEKEEAEVFLTISWQLPNEAELRVTHITQRWKDNKGHWEMNGELRKAGDTGLFGEAHPAVNAAPTPDRQHAQFPTRVIRGE